MYTSHRKVVGKVLPSAGPESTLGTGEETFSLGGMASSSNNKSPKQQDGDDGEVIMCTNGSQSVPLPFPSNGQTVVITTPHDLRREADIVYGAYVSSLSGRQFMGGSSVIYTSVSGRLIGASGVVLEVYPFMVRAGVGESGRGDWVVAVQEGLAAGVHPAPCSLYARKMATTANSAFDATDVATAAKVALLSTEGTNNRGWPVSLSWAVRLTSSVFVAGTSSSSNSTNKVIDQTTQPALDGEEEDAGVGSAGMSEKESDLRRSLEGLDEHKITRALGEILYPLVSGFSRLAGKITGMILELETDMIVDLILDELLLADMVSKAEETLVEESLRIAATRQHHDNNRRTLADDRWRWKKVGQQ